MADENPLKLPPPVIGNPYIGDIGRGKLSDSPQPRRPAIPFVLWYGEDEPAAVVASTDTPPRPIVVTADGPITAPMVGYNIIKTMVSPPVAQRPQPAVVGQQQSLNQLFQPPFVFVERQPGPSVAAPDVPAKASLTPQQALPFQQPFVFVERPSSEPPAASVGTPEQPVMVRAVELPWLPPQVFIAKTAAAELLDVTPPVPTVAVGVGMVGGASAFVNRAPASAVIVSATLPRPLVVSAWTPVDSGSASWVGFNADSGVSFDAPAKATIVGQVQPSPQQPFISISRSPVAPAVAPQVPPRPVVVGQIQPPDALPFVGFNRPKVFAAAPVAGDKVMQPVVVSAWTPIDSGFATWGGFNVDSGISPATDAPTRSLVVAAQQLPQTLPFVEVIQPKVFAAAPAAGDKATKPAVIGWPFPPEPVDQVILWAVVSDARPPDPTIVGSGPVPQALPFTVVQAGRTAPPAPPPAVPIRPTIVNAQPLPYPVQNPWAVQPKVNPPVLPQPPIPSTVVGQQPIPPQAAFVSTPKAGRWGNPPPNHRVITPQVNVDMSLPFRPNGWVRVAHGFAEALPLLYEGTVTGGVRDGAYVGGGGLVGAGVTGQVQAGYVTGGVR